MENKKSIFIIIGIIVILGLVFIFTGGLGEERNNITGESDTAEMKVLELTQAILEDHDCQRVMLEASDFLDENGDAVGIWNLLGVCQFDTGKFSEAKFSFEKVLSLDSTHEGAKTYVEMISKMSDGATGTVLAASETDLTQADFEAIANLKFANLSFDRAFEKPANIPKYIVGKYVSSTTFNNTASYISNELTKKNLTFSTSTAQLKSGFAFGNENELTSILVEGGTNVLVTIIYQKIK